MSSKIDAVLTAVNAQGVTLAALKQRVDDDHERLFGGQQPGILQYLAAKDKEISDTLTTSHKDIMEAIKKVGDGAKADHEKIVGEVTVVRADVAGLKVERKVGKAYVAGGVAAGTFMGWLIKAGLLKVGVHIP